MQILFAPVINWINYLNISIYAISKYKIKKRNTMKKKFILCFCYQLLKTVIIFFVF